MTAEPSRALFQSDVAATKSEDSVLRRFLCRSAASLTPDETLEILLMSLALKARRALN